MHDGGSAFIAGWSVQFVEFANWGQIFLQSNNIGCTYRDWAVAKNNMVLVAISVRVGELENLVATYGQYILASRRMLMR